MQVIELQPDDFFIETTNTGYVWQLVGFDDYLDIVLAKRILTRFNHPPKLGGTYWRAIHCEVEHMNPYATVKLLSI